MLCKWLLFWGTQNFGKQEMKGLEFEFDYIPYEGGTCKWLGHSTWTQKLLQDFITQWYYGQDAQSWQT